MNLGHPAQPADQIGSLQAQIAALDAQIGSGQQTLDAAGAARRSALMNQRNQLAQQLNTAQRSSFNSDPTRSSDAAMQQIIGLGTDAYNRVVNDPTDAMLMAHLQDVINGQKNPYDTTTVDALKTGAANQSAAAEMANNQQVMEQLQARGINPNDPAYQAALRKNQQQRQMSNQGTNLSINQNANVANFNAQQQAVAQAGTLSGQNKSATLQATNLLQNNYNQVGGGNPTAPKSPYVYKSPIPSWNTFSATK